MIEPDARSLTTHFRNAVLHIEPVPKWVRCVFAGETIADSKRAVILRSEGTRRGTLVYLFPLADVLREVAEYDAATAAGERRRATYTDRLRFIPVYGDLVRDKVFGRAGPKSAEDYRNAFTGGG